MRPSLWTALFVELEPNEAVRRIGEIGWRSVELSDEHLRMACAGPDIEESAERFRATAEDANVTVAQTHLFLLANVANPDAEQRRADVAAIKRQIEFCRIAGIGVGVIHPGGTECLDHNVGEEVRTARIESFRELSDYAGENGVRLAVENMNDRIGVGLGGRRRFGAELDELLGLLEAVDSPVMGICLDTSHAHVQGYDQPLLIRTLGELLIALHVSDNDGAADRHWIPLQGSIDWPPIVAALKEIGFGGDFNLEIPGARRCPPEFLDTQARYALEVAQKLLEGSGEE